MEAAYSTERLERRKIQRTLFMFWKELVRLEGVERLLNNTPALLLLLLHHHEPDHKEGHTFVRAHKCLQPNLPVMVYRCFCTFSLSHTHTGDTQVYVGDLFTKEPAVHQSLATEPSTGLLQPPVCDFSKSLCLQMPGEWVHCTTCVTASI